MKRSIMHLALMAVILGLGASAATAQPSTPSGQTLAPGTATAPATNVLGPKIKFAITEYDFGRAKSGDAVRFSYIFTNVGDQTLKISAVQPQCGCTTAGDWTKEAEPGATGTIPIQFNTGSYAAMPVLKTITVSCNDKAQSSLVLRLKGTIWKPIEVNPVIAVLNIPPDSQKVSTTVRVLNNTEESVSILGVEANNSMFKAEVTQTNVPGKEFIITVSTVPPLANGNTSGQVTIKTSSTNMPVVTVSVAANVQPAVIITPGVISLPQAPLAKAQTNSIAIQNNSTNALLVTEPSINSSLASVKIDELQAGRTFAALVSFQEGFEVAVGQPVVLTFKTTNPQYPVVRIPVIQSPRPRLPAAPAAPSPASAPSPRVIIKPTAAQPAGH